MSLLLYMDVHVPIAVTVELRARGVDVVRAQEDGADQLPDPALLDRATAQGRVLVSQDADLLREAHQRQQSGVFFSGLVYGHQLHVSVGQMIADLELLAKACDPADMINTVQYLPIP
jgi:hypothetical protein